MAYQSWSVVFGEQPSASKWNILGTNDASFNDGTGIGDAAVSYSKLGTDVGAMQVLADVTLGSAGDTISTGTITAKKFLKIYTITLNSGTTSGQMTFNGDTGANYAWRLSDNGGADVVGGSATFVPGQTAAASNGLFIYDIINFASSEKMIYGLNSYPSTAGAANTPGRREVVAKWANTANQITSIALSNSSGGDFAKGSRLLVLGRD